MADDKTLMPFGAHKGKMLANVPAQYLIWILENKKLSDRPDIEEYIKDNLDLLRRQAKEEYNEWRQSQNRRGERAIDRFFRDRKLE